MRFFKKLSQSQLRIAASLCAGVALLTLVAAGLGMAQLNHPQTLAAATALGDAQGVPPGLTGMAYPDYTYCQVLLDGKNPASGPFCRSFNNGVSPNTDTFYVSAFSVQSGGSGQTSYQSRTYIMPHTYDEGPASCAPYTFVSFNSKYGYQSGCGVTSKNGGSIYSQPTCPNGWREQSYNGAKYSAGTAECYYDAPGYLSGPSSASAGSMPSVGPGQSVTLEWSCLPSRRADWESCSYSQFDSSCHQNGGTYYSVGLAGSVSGSGPGFSPSGLYGSQTVTVPSSAGTYTYSLTCNGGSSGMSVNVNVTTPPATNLWLSASPNPTVWNSGTTLSWSATGGSNFDACYIGGGQYGSGTSVSASGSSNTVVLTSSTQYSFWCHDTYYGWVGPVYTTVAVNPPATPTAGITANGNAGLTTRTGASITIAGTFSTAGSDAGQSSYIEGDASNPDSQTGARTTTSYATSKSFTFTPVTPGTYTFYADASSSYYPTVTRYATVIVTVVGPSTSDGQDIMGWGWSDQAGWVSLSWFTDPTSAYAYGLRVDSSGNVTGYAWSDNLGWLSANSSDVSACGSAPTLSPSTHKLSGWLKAIDTNSSSWDGCISLNSSNKGDAYAYAVTINDSSSANSNFGTYTNAAWSPNVPQWTVFDGYCATTAVSCIDAAHYNYYQFCFAQSGGVCAKGSYCQNGTGCVTPTPATGCLQTGGSTSCTPPVKSYRLVAGHTAPLYWNVSGVTYNCTIDGSDGEHWDLPLSGSPSKSGSGSITTAAINSKTTFTMECDNYVFTDQITVNISPNFQEI